MSRRHEYGLTFVAFCDSADVLAVQENSFYVPAPELPLHQDPQWQDAGQYLDGGASFAQDDSFRAMAQRTY